MYEGEVTFTIEKPPLLCSFLPFFAVQTFGKSNIFPGYSFENTTTPATSQAREEEQVSDLHNKGSFFKLLIVE